MKEKCKCGTVVNISIQEGNNPGCAERENVYCPTCNELLHTGVYNDATVRVTKIK
jgi:hypothetical protein